MRRTSWSRGAGGGTNSCEFHLPGRAGPARPKSMRSGVNAIRPGGKLSAPAGILCAQARNLRPRREVVRCARGVRLP
eukprot:3492254-Lingulodinium_polyedra.AAC.1